MRCAWCTAELVDADGQPRWDVLTATLPSARLPGELAFICAGSCRPRSLPDHLRRMPRGGRLVTPAAAIAATIKLGRRRR